MGLYCASCVAFLVILVELQALHVYMNLGCVCECLYILGNISNDMYVFSIITLITTIIFYYYYDILLYNQVNIYTKTS